MSPGSVARVGWTAAGLVSVGLGGLGIVVPGLPTFAGKGLQPGVDLDDAAGLLDFMDAGDASR